MPKTLFDDILLFYQLRKGPEAVVDYYTYGDITVDSLRLVVSVGKFKSHAGVHIIDSLIELIKSNGEFISTYCLYKKVWPKGNVGQRAVGSTMRRVIALLGPGRIEAARHKGYRLIKR